MNTVSEDIRERTEIARMLLSRGMDEVDFELAPDVSRLPFAEIATKKLEIPFPSGLKPVAQPPEPAPDSSDPLPRADVLIVTWTVDEQDALADVLTPGQARKKWIRYDRNFASHFAPLIRTGAPALKAKRLGSWMPTKIRATSALCYKSELHLNQDGIKDKLGPGIATLPVKDMFVQLMEEVMPRVVLTVGTSGGVFRDHDLGDVCVSRAAKFRLQSEFRNAPYTGAHYKSHWQLPDGNFAMAMQLMQDFAENLVESPFSGPTVRHVGTVTPPKYAPDIKQEGKGGIPEFHPALTTDYFEFGTSSNDLDQEGIAVEMDDAALGLACLELSNPPWWACVRNLSDPQIRGDLENDLQTEYAVWYYKKYGYWTSVMGALATWAIVAGL